MSSNSQLVKWSNDELLTLKEIAANIQEEYGHLYAFARQDGFADAIGAVDVPNVKGVRYPPYAQEIFAHLMQMKKQDRVTPGTSVEWVRNAVIERGILPFAKSSNEGAIMAFEKLSNETLVPIGQAIASALSPTLERIARAIEAGSMDRLLTQQEARQQYGVRPIQFNRIRGARLIDGRRVVWLSEIRDWMEEEKKRS